MVEHVPKIAQLLIFIFASVSISTGGQVAIAMSSSPVASRPAVHPAVVRVIVPGLDGTSFGSGALVAVAGDHGLVVTNWHVVREATGQIIVAFPNGFRTNATVLQKDEDWDLAALAIWRPNVQPIPLAPRAARPGEELTIVGYGSGKYRAVTGRCTQYVSPGGNHPYEMVELSASARNGDSGGPILNSNWELSGILFGAAFGRTTGSYCGRVGRFLNSVATDFRSLPPYSPKQSPPQLAQTPRPQQYAIEQPEYSSPSPKIAAGQPRFPNSIPANSDPTQSPTSSADRILPIVSVKAPPETEFEPINWDDLVGTTHWDKLKSLLAVLGLVAMVLHGMRLSGATKDP